MTHSYASTLRAEQASETRNRILAAFAAEIAAAPDVFSLGHVAAQAGVSLRTLHHHFPDNESRVCALADWIDRKVGLSRDEAFVPGTDIGHYARRMAEAFFANEQLLRAQMAPGVAREVRRRRRKKREDRLESTIRDLVRDPRRARIIAAMLSWLIGADTACALKDRFGLGNDEIVRAIEWAARALVAATKQDSGL